MCFTGPKKRYSTVASDSEAIISAQSGSSSGRIGRRVMGSVLTFDRVHHSYLLGYIEMMRCESGDMILCSRRGRS